MKQSVIKKIKNPYAVCLLAVFCCALWGSAFPVIKIGYKLLDISSGDYSSQILFAGIRFTFAGIFTIIIGSIIAKKLITIKPKGYYKVCALSLFQTVLQYLFFYIGLAKTTGTKSSILDSTSVFFSVLIASLLLKQERLTAKKIAGCIVGFAGVVIINLTNGFADSSISFIGEGFIIISALSYAVSSVMIKRFSADENPVALSGYQFILGGIIMIVFGFALGGRLSITSYKAVLLLAYLALLSAIAYTVWGILLKYNDVSKVTVFGFMTPVFGCLLSAVLLKESLAGSVMKTVISLLLVCFGIFLVNSNLNISRKNYES
ncbi:MAG: DMT family transporter [Acetobacter sp.]|nr:DMT family transporter [Bacteroides sp.]MCM1341476.1 DMT family transporter [Acetobacter sp.]MCM1434169.1 DMT family transporter [Clostridiales bacterium]